MVADTTNKFLPGQYREKRLFEKYGERLMKHGGGHWNKEQGYRELPYQEVLSSEFDNRVMND